MSGSPSDLTANDSSDDGIIVINECELDNDGSTLTDLENTIEVKIQKLEGRKRCLEACIDIPHTCHSVWDVLTDYEGLSDFIPNLAESCVVGEEEGCTLLRQVGVQKLSFLKFSAAVTLKMETAPTERIEFKMVEGDFVEFFGCWQLTDLGETTRLSYAVTILPPRKMPIQIVQRRLKADLSSNLSAIQQEVSRRCA